MVAGSSPAGPTKRKVQVNCENEHLCWYSNSPEPPLQRRGRRFEPVTAHDANGQVKRPFPESPRMRTNVHSGATSNKNPSSERGVPLGIRCSSAKSNKSPNSGRSRGPSAMCRPRVAESSYLNGACQSCSRYRSSRPSLPVSKCVMCQRPRFDVNNSVPRKAQLVGWQSVWASRSSIRSSMWLSGLTL